MTKRPLLEVRNLRVWFPARDGTKHPAVDGVDLVVEEGELSGLIGESGSGKSLAMLALMKLVPWPGQVQADRMQFGGIDLLAIPSAHRRHLLGRSMAMIFQQPRTSLNPCYTVGFQLGEALQAHARRSRQDCRRSAIELLERVGIPSPEARLRAFPHQLSGGMCQRVMIAMAIAAKPRLLIADEPTTALDVTIQAQILELLTALQKERDMSVILISHDIGLVTEWTRRVGVMYAGRLVECAASDRLLAAPRHPYTAALIAALPHLNESGKRLAAIEGTVPGTGNRPAGCLFEPRCKRSRPDCRSQRPELRADFAGGSCACHFPLNENIHKISLIGHSGKRA